jgi:DNA mismatch repair protein MutS
MALINEYLDLTKQYSLEYGEKTIVLMQVGAFFEVYGCCDSKTDYISGSRITDFSSICDLNIADKKVCVGSQNVIMAGFSHYMIDKYVKKLKDAGYTIVVYTQDEQAKNTTRSLSAIYSPGTYFSQETTSQITNNIVCIWFNVVTINSFKNIYIGIANIDIYTGKSTIFEYNEKCENVLCPTTFDSLERFISIYNPCEAILIGNLREKDFENICNYANIQCNAIHRISLLDEEDPSSKKAFNCEKQNYQKVVLEKFFTITDFESFYSYFYENAMACQAYCYLLDFIFQHNPNLVNKLKEPIYDKQCTDRLVLANHSLKQLNIIDDSSYIGKYSSVEKLLNLCLTPMGRREFSLRLLNPTTNKSWINEEYDMTEYLLTDTEPIKKLQENLRHHLLHIKDLSKINRQIIMKKISPKFLYLFYNNLKTVQEFAIGLLKDPIITAYLAIRLKEPSNIILKYVEKMVYFLESHLNLEVCNEYDISQQQHFDTNFIREGVDILLDEKSRELLICNEKLDAIRLHLNSRISKYENAKVKGKGKSKTVAGDTNSARKKTKTEDYVKLYETEKNHLSLIATKRRCSILKEIFKKSANDSENGEIELSYSTGSFKVKLHGGLTFSTQSTSNDSLTSSEINELCKNITNTKIQMRDMISLVYFNILTQLSEFQSEIHMVIDLITTVDVILTKAFIARKYNYCKPVLLERERSFFEAVGMRHALIEHLQQNENYVSNDLDLGIDGRENGILLFGTNAVGKTSLIRSVGICIIMAQSGLYVPCSEFNYSPYHYIFTRILGNDNIFKGLSTFAVEMSELRTILRLSDDKSLVLGDELCSGTESISATSIFVTGIQQLAKRNCNFIFATHLHEITGYSEILELASIVSMKHMEVFYDREKDKLIYDRKIKEGSGDNMYGLEVCKSLHLPLDFMENAYQIRSKYHPPSKSILTFKTSHYNSQKIVGFCEICKEVLGTEVHHVEQQKTANKKGFILKKDRGTIHKNRLSNLLTVCEKCHKEIHKHS